MWGQFAICPDWSQIIHGCCNGGGRGWGLVTKRTDATDGEKCGNVGIINLKPTIGLWFPITFWFRNAKLQDLTMRW